jgi:SAM-dependent methyltransferase
MLAPATDSHGVPWSNTARMLDRGFEMLRAARPSPGDFVDVPCGNGYLASRAADAGWRVKALDLDPAAFATRDGVQFLRADMNGPLPIPTASADALACCEGIEHAENPWSFLREIRRVIRPGGHVLFTLPNTIDLRQRLRVLRRGYVSHYFPDVPSHVNSMGPVALCHALLHAGFSIVSVRSRKTYAWPLHWLAPLFGLPPKCGLPDDVRRMLSSRQVLFGRHVIVLAQAGAGA